MVEFRASVFGVLVFINSLEIEIEVSLPEPYNSVIVSNKGNDTYSATFSTGVYLEVVQRNGFLSTIVVSLLPTYFDLTQGLWEYTMMIPVMIFYHVTLPHHYLLIPHWRKCTMNLVSHVRQNNKCHG